MRNFTFSPSKLFRLNFLVLFLILISHSASAQFYTKHYIAPAPWQYFSKANEIVIATNSLTTVNITLSKSDGTLVSSLTAIKGAPAVYRFAGKPSAVPALTLNTVLNSAGLIVTGDAPISINLRNVASDALGGDGTDQDIKGNAALTSFGDAGIGIRFRVGYYRDGSLGNFGNFGDQRPIYSIMAIASNTTVTIAGVVKTTLNAGESYLFKAPIGTLVESSNPCVMNTSAAIDTPENCGDGAFNQIPPEAVLGSEYFIERGKGNNTAEQTTVVATKDNTTVIVDSFSTTGTLVGTISTVLATAGSFYTFRNGISNTNFSASRVFADKNVAVYSGTAQSCEVDISTIAPVSECGGSNFIETAKFRNYGTGSLPYFGYILLKDDTAVVNVNGTNIETVSGISPRHQLGSTGWYIINFEDTQIGSPNVLSISSVAKLTVSIVQQGGGFSMAGFFSNFAAQPEDPTMTYVSGGGCANNTATLTSPSGFAPYQWYLNGTAITGANSNSYVATKTGSYSVASTLACGLQTQSKPVSVTLCTDLGVTKTVDNATPCVGSNVEFTVKLSNLGVNNATGVSVNDLLPSGYTFVSATPSIGSYNSMTGVWSIGDINGGIIETLKIIAKVNATGVYTNTASLPNTTTDNNPGNNTASVSTTPNPLPTLTITNPAAVCSPLKVDLTLPAVTSGSSANLTFTYWTNSTATISYNTPTLATAGTYYIKGTTANGCSVIKSVVITVNTTPAPPASSVQTFCSAESKTVNDLAVTLDTGSTKKWYNLGTGGVAYLGNELLATGTYYVSQTSGSGCESSRTSVSVTVNPITAVPTIASTAATCSANGISKVSNYDSTLTYAFTPSGPTIASTGVINGMTVGTNYTITAKNINNCTSSASAPFNNVAKLITPVVPTIAPTLATCSADGISTVSNYDANLTYTFDPAGPTIASTGVISGMVTGTDYTLTAGNTTCTSAPTLTFRNNAKLVIPAVPTIAPTVATCSAEGISTVSSYDGTLTYTFDPAGPTIASTGVISGMVIGTDYTLTAGNTTCTSASTSAFRNNAKLVTPAVPTIVPTPATCSADGISTVSNYDGTLTYTFDPAGPTIASTGVISGMVIGADYTLTAGNSTCTSASTLTFRNNAKLVTPVVPTIAPTAATCSVDGISTVSNYDANLTYAFDPAGPTIASTGVISGMVIGTDYTLTARNTTCTSAPTLTFRNNAKLVTPVVPTIAPTAATCSADGISTVSNYDANLTYTFDPTGPTIASTGIISGMLIGTDYTLTAGNSTCTSAPTSAFRNNAKLVTPVFPTIALTPATCSADGISTVSNYDGTLTYTFDPSGPTIASTGVISGMVIGTDYTLTAGNTTCTSALTSVFRNNAKLVTPVIQTIVPTPATCSADGISTVSNYDANLTYTFDPAGPTIASTGVILGMVTGTDYTLTAGNTTCTSAPTSAFRNNAKLVSPVIPLVSSVTQPTCATATGSFIITNYDASYTYAITPSAGVIQNGDKITALEGSYTLNAVLGNCTSGSSLIAVINAQPETPVQPLLSAVMQQTCAVSTGSFSISNYNSSYNYLITPSAGVTQTGSMITAPAGIYTIIAEANGCESLSSNVVIDSKICANTDNTFGVQIPSSTAVVVGNVTSNDTLNGFPVTSATTIVTPITNGPLSIDADGELTLAPNTPSGTYTITYQICEKGATPDNCATTTATVVVGKGSIIALTENTAPINGSIGGTTFSLTNNDTLNGHAVIIKNSNGGVILTSISVPTGLTLNPDGTVTVKAGTPIGNYDIEYTICEYINATTNCATIKSYVPVIGAALQANNDNAGTVDSNKGQSSSTSIFHNDTLNGSVLNPADVILSTVVSNPYLILKADGTIEVKPGTPSGNYELTYQICEVLNPSSNCSQAVAKISVVNVADPQPPITPFTRIIINNEEVVSVDGINGAIEFINVLDNDLLNGLPINPLDIIITNTPQNPYFEFNPDGTVNVKPNTPGGNYVLTYQVCEKAKPSNCNTGTLSVFVEVPAIAIIKTAVFNDENNSGFANAGETIAYKFKVTNTGNVPLKNVMVSDLLPGIIFSGQAIDLDVNESDEHNFTATYKITQSDINKGSVSNQATVKGTSDKGIIVEDKSDDENNTGDRPTVLPLNGCVIKVFNAFSPNGDDKNSRFYIQGLECYTDNTVEIYNRWGILVYDIEKYNNEDRAFKGFSEGRTTVKQTDGLPVGTYFYILKYKDSESNPKELSGYLYINK